MKLIQAKMASRWKHTRKRRSNSSILRSTMEELVLCKICNDCLDIKVKEMDDHPSRINGIRKGLNIQLYS